MGAGVELRSEGRAVLWHELERISTSVGRNPECDLCLPYEGVASVQFVLELRGQKLWLLNRGAAGTAVNGDRVAESLQLANEDRIDCGAIEAVVRFDRSLQRSGGTLTLGQQGASRRRFVVTAPQMSGRWELNEALTMGSDATNDIIIDDPYVSAFHARLSVEGDRCIVRDLGSRNGVFVGNQVMREGEIPDGATLRVGQTVFAVAAEGDHEHPIAFVARGARLVGSSPPMELLRQNVERMADNNAPVLVTGPTGSGKEVVARMLAALSSRAGAPFVALNCGTLGRQLIESELFGHEKGAFTGAVERRIGAFESAHGGTLFLDEIGELPIELQPQLLRVLETRDVRRVGSSQSFPVDVRLVAATNRRLEEEVREGRFREDLFHRLHVLVLELPSLNERREDIADLVMHFLRTLHPDEASLEITDAALDALRNHSWPGNVRELRNVLQRAVILRASDSIDAEDITFSPSTLKTRVETGLATGSCTLEELERAAILAELQRHGGNKTDAARVLGVSRSTIHRKIDEYGIEVG